jgi:hypothetical protein
MAYFPLRFVNKLVVDESAQTRCGCLRVGTIAVLLLHRTNGQEFKGDQPRN